MPAEKKHNDDIKNDKCFGKGITPEPGKNPEIIYNIEDYYNLDVLKDKIPKAALTTILSALKKLSYEDKAKYCFGFEEYSHRDDDKENITPHISKEFILILKDAGIVDFAETNVHVTHVKTVKNPELVVA